jgi:hypothetical protein
VKVANHGATYPPSCRIARRYATHHFECAIGIVARTPFDIMLDEWLERIMVISQGLYLSRSAARRGY